MSGVSAIPRSRMKEKQARDEVVASMTVWLRRSCVFRWIVNTDSGFFRTFDTADEVIWLFSLGSGARSANALWAPEDPR